MRYLSTQPGARSFELEQEINIVQVRNTLPQTQKVFNASRTDFVKITSKVGLCGVTVSALGSQPRGPGFDPRAEWKNLGGISDTLTPLFT